jgi:hypothetical protein
MGELIGAMAELLHNHIRSLVLDDAAVRAERAAYERLVKEQRAVAARLDDLASAMRSYRDLPMAAHEESVLSDRMSLDVFAAFVQAEESLLALLQKTAAEHRSMLSGIENR